MKTDSTLPDEQKAAALAHFTDYFVRNYPGPDTIISRPTWHAPKIFRAAMYAVEAATQGAAIPTAPEPTSGHIEKLAAKYAESGCLGEDYIWWKFHSPERLRAFARALEPEPVVRHVFDACSQWWRNGRDEGAGAILVRALEALFTEAEPLFATPPAIREPEPLTDEQCDAIYEALSAWGEKQDPYEYGPPVMGDDCKDEGREVIRAALATPAPAPSIPVVHPAGLAPGAVEQPDGSGGLA